MMFSIARLNNCLKDCCFECNEGTYRVWKKRLMKITLAYENDKVLYCLKDRLNCGHCFK